LQTIPGETGEKKIENYLNVVLGNEVRHTLTQNLNENFDRVFQKYQVLG
jgi:hypothetical protein